MPPSARRPILFLLLGTLLFACNKDDEPGGATDAAFYEVTFIGRWSAQTHPTDYPAGASFSRPVGMVHNLFAQLFTAGTPASPGLQALAEEGETQTLQSELMGQLGLTVGTLLLGEPLSSGTDSAAFTIEVRQNYPLVSLAAKLSPSPDWFVAVLSVELFQNGNWLDEVEVPVEVFDAGTDSGTTFDAPDQPTFPPGTVQPLLAPPLGNGAGVSPPVAAFRFVRKS
ncbi:MAG: hypothetical protein D6765_04825 [Bacteroidetes bacterium]|nr:MAG: hypothetical protein D6765_04825 [Bacteroidota bacterium]